MPVLRSTARVALVAILCALGGCREPESARAPDAAAPASASEAAATPAHGDWLVQWILSDAENLNPVISNDATSDAILGQIMSSLTTVHPQTFEQVPVVAAELPRVSHDHLTYAYRIRQDATFSDGKPVTVEDVLFSMKVIKNPEVDSPFLRNYFQSVVDARALDYETVEFRCAEPYFRNDIILGGMSILPRHFYDPQGELESLTVADLAKWDSIAAAKKEHAIRFAASFNKDFHRRVLGAGAYVLADPARDLVTGERVVLRHRPDFWAPGEPLKGDGYADRIFYRVINNPDAALVALKAGTLDTMGLSPLQHLKQTSTPGFEKRFAKQIGYTPTYIYIGWNQLRPFFRDKRVRQALSHFVDRDRIIEKVLFGFGENINSPVYKFSPEYDRDIPDRKFDPARGRRLLDEAGWVDHDGDGIRDKLIDGRTTPLRFEIISNSGNTTRRNVGLLTVGEMKRAGIDVAFREVDWSILLGAVEKFDYDAVILGWQFSANDPDLYQVWHSSQAVPGGSNHVAFKNAEADRILVEYRKEFDKERRIRLYRRLQEIIHEEAPYTFLFMQKGISAYDRRFRGVVWYPSGRALVNEWWVPIAEQRYGR